MALFSSSSSSSSSISSIFLISIFIFCCITLEIDASSRLYKMNPSSPSKSSSNYFKLHDTLNMDENPFNKHHSSITLPSEPPLPSLELNWGRKFTPKTLSTDSSEQEQALPRVAETFRWLLSSRILSEQSSSSSSSERVSDGSMGSGGSQGSASRVVVIIGLTAVLVVLLALGVSFICFNGRQRQRQRHGHGDGPSNAGNHGQAAPAQKKKRSHRKTAAAAGQRRTYSSAPPVTNGGPGPGLGGSASVFFSLEEPQPVTDVPHVASPVTMPNPQLKNALSVEPTAATVLDPENPIPQPSTVPDFGLTAFDYRVLHTATNGFSTKNRLGMGGFGTVFKGLIDGKIVAVKLLKNETVGGDAEFRTEVSAISRASHKNIVSLIGYCIHDDKRLIVFEYVANNSLHHYLRGGDKVEVLDWEKRMKIARGTAKGLAYLHEDCPQKIIHRDVKPANILLDVNFEAKVADFGIAKLCPEFFNSYISTDPVGTIGYVDPCYLETRKLTVKSDVYSFGVVLLELTSGLGPPTVHDLVSSNELPEALKKLNFDAIADPKLQKYDTREMTLMVACADACLRQKPKDRPLMKQISQVLEGLTSPDELKMETRHES